MFMCNHQVGLIYLVFGLNFHLHPYLVYATHEPSGETARTCSSSEP